MSRAQAKRMRKLRRRKWREKHGLFLAEGVRAVEDLLAADVPLELTVVSPALEETERGRELAAALASAVSVERADDAELAALAPTETPQGVLAVAETPRRELAALEVDGAAVIVVLDGIQDPGNFGTVARSAEALGAAFLAAPPGTVDPWNPKAVRAAAGASFRLPIVRPAFAELREWLRRRGFALYGADAAGDDVTTIDPPARAALVLGNEGAGLGPEAREAVDALVAVPMRGRAESLNVAVAGGILLYELTRRQCP